MPFSHIDEGGAARMVDVSEKPVTQRKAIAEGAITLSADTLRLLKEKALPKGDVLAVAKIAGIGAAKRAAELIPLCHPLRLTHIAVDFDVQAERILVRAGVHANDVTGAEMEALTAAAVACLTIYDMCKAVDRAMVIGNIRLIEKTKSERENLIIEEELR